MKTLKPEKIVEIWCMDWCARKGWRVCVIESKATFSKKVGRYLRSRAAPVGHSDLVGCTDTGHGVFIELKAPGKLNTLSEEQEKFLLERRACGAFTAVVDSPELLDKLWEEFKTQQI